MVRRPRVGMFVTCLVDFFRPSVGFAAIKLMEEAGCEVEVPASQTCCGQPAWNSGNRASAKAVARTLLDIFEDYDYVVAPSGSCAGMIRFQFPELFGDEGEAATRARALAEKTHELVSFLVDVLEVKTVTASFPRTITYHDSCSGLRELGIKNQPRTLLNTVEGLSFEEMADSESCCGFGGTFCVKYPELSDRMVGDRVKEIEKSGAEVLLGGDMGCLLNMAGKLRRLGSNIEVRHVAEVLAGLTNGNSPIGR